MVLTWDGSFIGDITDDIVKHGNVNYIRHCPGETNLNLKFTKICIDKIHNDIWMDLCMDVLKGIFYLPSFGFHLAQIRTTSVNKEDGSEITTRARYCIRSLEYPVERLKGALAREHLDTPTEDLIRRLFMFAKIMGVKNINESMIEIRKINGVIVPTLTSLNEVGTKSLTSLNEVGVNSLTSMSNETDLDFWFKGKFDSQVSNFLKPYRSATILKFKFDKILSVYFPDRKAENDKWMNEVLERMNLYFQALAPKVPVPVSESLPVSAPGPAPPPLVLKNMQAPKESKPVLKPAPATLPKSTPKVLKAPPPVHVRESIKEPAKQAPIKAKGNKAKTLIPLPFI